MGLQFTFFAKVLRSLDVSRCSRGAEYDGEKQHLAQVTGCHLFVESVNILRAPFVCRHDWTTRSSVALLVLFCLCFAFFLVR